MAGETEIDRMLVRLIGDGSSYKMMMQEASMMTKQLGAQVTQLGTTLTKKLTVPLGIAAGVAVKSFASFDQAMTESTSIMKATTEQVERMKKTALELSGKTAQSPKELAESYFFLASAGKDAEQSMALLPQVSKFATAGAFDMATATDLLTDAQSALGMSSKDAAKDLENITKVSDVLVKANTLANASVQQFSEALTSDAGASMRAFNIDLEEGVAILAAMADQGSKGAVAGSEFARALRLIAKGARDNSSAFETLGIEVFDSEGEFRNLADVIKDMEKSLGGMSTEAKGAALEQLGFNALAQRAILPLIGTSNAISEYEKKLKVAGGTTDQVANKQLKSFANQLKQVKNQINVVFIEIGEILAPSLIKVANLISDLTKKWRGLSTEQKETIVKIAAMAAAVGPLLIVTGGLITKIGTLIQVLGLLKVALIKTGIGAIAVGLGVLAAKFLSTQKGVDSFKESLEPFQEVWQTLQETWKEIQPTVMELAKTVAQDLKTALVEMLPVIQDMIKFYAEYLKVLVKVAGAVVKVASKVAKTSLDISKSIHKGFTKPLDSNSGVVGGLLSPILNAQSKDASAFDAGRLMGNAIGGPRQANVFDQLFNGMQRIRNAPDIFRALGESGEMFVGQMDEAIDKAVELHQVEQDIAAAEKERQAQLEKQMALEEKQKKNIDEIIKGLETQVKTYGLSRKELALLNAEENKATPFQMSRIEFLTDQLEAMENETKAKEEARQATEDARAAEERFQNSIKSFGIEGVGRGIEALSRIEESRRLRADVRGRQVSQKQTLKPKDSGFVLSLPSSQGGFSASVEQMVKELQQVNGNTREIADKESVELKPANLN